jgi:hypothetical protein
MKNIKIINSVNHDFKTDNYYCYELIDPSNNEVFYVGKGKHYRFRDHLYPYSSNNKHKNNKIKKILEENTYIIARIIFSCISEQQAYNYEQTTISNYNNLTNLTVGGSNAPQKPCRSVNQYNLFGELIRTFTSYHAAAASFSSNSNLTIPSQILECCRGATPTCKNYYWSWADVNKILRPRTKILPVSQWSLQGEYINRFTSAAEAGRALAIDGRDILTSIRRGPNCTSNGFIWRYLKIINC